MAPGVLLRGLNRVGHLWFGSLSSVPLLVGEKAQTQPVVLGVGAVQLHP